MITVKNTKAVDVHIAVYDQLPKSNDGQIKVRLIKPTISVRPLPLFLSVSVSFIGESDVSLCGGALLFQEVDTSVVLTASNNVKWKLDLPAGKQVQLPFTYQLEWPLGQEINA
jgi:hypothetical protein